MLSALAAVLLLLVPALGASVGEGRVEVVLQGAWPQVEGADRAAWLAAVQASGQRWAAAAGEALVRLGGEVLGGSDAPPRVRAFAPRGALPALAQLPGLRALGPDAPLGALQGDGHARPPADGLGPLGVTALHAAGWTGKGILLAVLDSGLDLSHPALGGAVRVAAWRDFVQSREEPYDDYGHGTFVASLAAGRPVAEGNFSGGAAPDAALLVAKVLDSAGKGLMSDAEAGLVWAFAQGAHVALAAFGGSACTQGEGGICDTVDALVRQGMVVVAAAGNKGPGNGTVLDPAAAAGSVAVGALNETLAVLPGSARGPVGNRTAPDVAAVGDNVRGAWRDGGWTVLSGTSVAAGFVAGSAAALLEAHRAWLGRGWDGPRREAEDALTRTARDLDAAGPDNATGWGLPQLGAALREVEEGSTLRLEAGVEVEKSAMLAYDANNITLRVQNPSLVDARGRAVLLVLGPDGAPVLDRARDLEAPFRGKASWTVRFDSGTLPHGDYAAEVRYGFAWRNGSADGEGAWEGRAGFTLYRPLLALARAHAAAAAPGALLGVALRALSAGNLDALNVSLVEGVPLRAPLVPHPGEAGLLTQPDPRGVAADLPGQRLNLSYRTARLALGDALAVDYRVLALAPGPASLEAWVRYEDVVGHVFWAALATQVVVAG